MEEKQVFFVREIGGHRPGPSCCAFSALHWSERGGRFRSRWGLHKLVLFAASFALTPDLGHSLVPLLGQKLHQVWSLLDSQGWWFFLWDSCNSLGSGAGYQSKASLRYLEGVSVQLVIRKNKWLPSFANRISCISLFIKLLSSLFLPVWIKIQSFFRSKGNKYFNF